MPIDVFVLINVFARINTFVRKKLGMAAFFISRSDGFRLLYAKFSSVVTYEHRDKEHHRT